MIDVEECGPPTTPSLRGPVPVERRPIVESITADAIPEWTQPLSTAVPLIRVARWMQYAAKKELDMGPGATATHVALLFVVAQYQGQNEYSTAAQGTLAAAARACGRAARTALAELVAHGWLLRQDEPHGRHGYETRYAIASTPGDPIPGRSTLRQPLPDPPGNKYQPPPAITADPVCAPPATIAGPPRQLLPEGVGNHCRTPPAINAYKEITEETTEETSKKTIARVPASERAHGSRTMPTTGDLFGGSDPAALRRPAKTARAKPTAPKAPKTPKTSDLYSAAYVAGQSDAEQGCGFRALTDADCRMIGMAAAAHAKNPATGERLSGEALLAWIRKTSAEYRRAADPAFSKGFSAHAFATWLDAGRPVTRKVPLPLPPEPPRPKREIPPPRPVPEIFCKLAEEDAAKGIMLPFLRNRTQPEKT